MAPEQAAGRNRDLGRGTDVYALGATLYELLTGRPAFRGETMTETLRMVLDTDPVSPRTLRPGLSRDLETVCLSCLEKDPAKRYPSASALAEDLNRFLSGEPIFARPAGPVERGLKSIRRHPAAAAMFALAVALIVCLGGVTAWSNALLRSHNVALQREADRADMNARLAQRLLYADRLRLARQALDLDQLERTQEILGDIRPETEGSEPRGFVWGHLWRQARREVVLLGDDVRWCDRFTISADGRSLASYDLKGRVVIWDLVAQNKRSVVETLAPIEPSVSLSPDGRLLAAVEQFDPLSKLPRRGRVWETSSAKLRAELPAPKGERLESLTILTGERVLMTTTRPGSAGLTARIYEPTCGPGPPRVLATVAEGASFVNPSPDGTRLAVYRDGRLDVVDASTGAAPVEIHDGTCAEPVTHAEFARDARTLLTFAGRRATFWDTVTGRPRASHDLVEPPVLYTLSQDGTTLAVLTPGGVVTLWNRDRGHVAEVESDDLKREAEIHLALSADGTRLALSSNGQTTRAAVVTLWDATDGHWLQNFPGRRDDVHFLSFLPGGRSLLVGGGDWPRVWRFDRPGEIAPAIEHSDEAWAVTFSPDGLTLATGSDDTDEPTTLKLWDAAKGTFRKGWKAHPATVSAIAFHPGGRLLATAGFHPMENLRLWDPRDGRLLAKMYGHTDRVRSVVFSPDGTKLATASNDHTVRIWDVASHKPLAVLTGHTDTVRNVVFAPDGRTLASAANDRTVRTWDVASKKQLKLFGGTGKFSAVAYTIDGATLVAANEDGVISLWNPTTGEARAPIRSDDAELRCLAVSPDGRTIAAAGASKSVHIWDLLSGQQLITLPPHRQIVNSIGFSPDGRTLASASHDGMIHVWRADTPPPP
jgi:WD40 repeat protein